MTDKKDPTAHLWKKGCKRPNPAGRPKKVNLPDNVREILSNASPAIMKQAIKEALGHPDRAGNPTKPINTRVLSALLDKMAPSLKSVEIKGSESLPTMILINSNTSPELIKQIKGDVIEQQHENPVPVQYHPK